MHIRFGDDEDDDEQMADRNPAAWNGGGNGASEAAPTSGRVDTSCTAPLRQPWCCNAALASSSGQPGSSQQHKSRNSSSYVFRVLHNAANNAVAVSTSDQLIKLYSLSGQELGFVLDLTGHGGRITDLCFGDAANPALVHSSSADGSVRGWDIRSGQCIEQYTVQGSELFTCSLLGHMVAAGGSGEVLFWDRRQAGGAGTAVRGPKPLAKLDDTHMDDVTQVRFHSSGRVLSASTDGLIAVHDVSGSLEEDDAFQAAVNVATSVEELGLYGPSQERMWVRTGTESLHLWEWMQAAVDDGSGGDEQLAGSMPFAEWGDARGAAAQAAVAAGPSAAVLQQLDYLVTCHYDTMGQQLLVVSGAADGQLGFFPVSEHPGSSDGGAGAAAGTAAAGVVAMAGASLRPPVMLLQGGHSSVVRSVHCFSSGVEATAPFCVTGGEDGRICLWALEGGPSTLGAPHAASAGAAVHRGGSTAAMDGDGEQAPVVGGQRPGASGGAVRRPKGGVGKGGFRTTPY